MTKIEYDKQRPRVTPPHASLRGVRVALGLHLKDVSEKVALVLGKSFTVGALSAIELGYRGASPEVLEALSTALGLPADSLAVDYEPKHTRRKSEEADAA